MAAFDDVSMTGSQQWEPLVEMLAGGTRRIAVATGQRRLSFGEVVGGWRDDSNFRDFFNDLLASASPPAWFWEMPPLTRSILGTSFECVQVPSAALAGVRADPAPFAAPFSGCDGVGAVGFANLGGDAWLVAPCPRDDSRSACAHFADFVRGAPRNQRDALWRMVGESVVQRLGNAPLWVSTSGLGVYWVHVRLDSRPKYYTHAPYRRHAEPESGLSDSW